MAPAAWVRRLVTLCDQALANPYSVIKIVLEDELGLSVDELFERFDADPLGSASIAQVFVLVSCTMEEQIKAWFVLLVEMFCPFPSICLSKKESFPLLPLYSLVQ